MVPWSAASAEPRPDCSDFSTDGPLDSHDQRWCQALAFKESYLERGFVETIPDGGGSARGVKSRLATRFSSGGTSSVSGTVSVDELEGHFRLKLASTDNVLYYGRKVTIKGVAGSGEGRLVLYSHVDVDLWKLAAVLVDRPVRGQEPPESGLILKGYTKTEISAGADKAFTSALIALAGDFFLLVAAPDGVAKNIRIEIGEP